VRSLTTGEGITKYLEETVMGFFLKLIGSTEAPWQGLYKEEYVDFPRLPLQVRTGDFLVLYAVGGLKRVFAIAEVKSEAYKVPINDTPRWSFRVDVEYLVNVPAEEGVPIEEVSTPRRDLARSINQGSYMSLNSEEYEQAFTKLRKVPVTNSQNEASSLMSKDKHDEGLKEYFQALPRSLPISTVTLPLESHKCGVIRITGTRVSLDSVIFAFKEGSTPEEIAHQYTTLDLADVYTVISFYLQYHNEVEDYLSVRRLQRDDIRREVESRFDPNGIRERLLVRRRRIA
jgi:uncharacterized protein (DUF433 family)